MLLTFVAIQLCEELGWTGFLQQHLQEKRGAIVAALLVAPAFAASHLMVNLLGAGAIGPALAMLGVQLVFAVAFRLVVGSLYNRAGGSVVVAALFHASLNTMTSAFVVGVVGEASAQWLPLAVIAAGGLAIGGGAAWRRLPRTRAPAAA
jgi:membrane protease YdiL (CAAX protease family)